MERKKTELTPDEKYMKEAIRQAPWPTQKLLPLQKLEK